MAEEQKKTGALEALWGIIKPTGPKSLADIEKERKAKEAEAQRAKFLKENPPEENKRPPQFKTSMGEDMGEFGKKWDDTFA